MNWPSNFIWGTGASSTQTEGAAPASDYIDREREGRVPVSGTGNDFGTRYAEDFALYASLGLTHHRLSIEWARIEPAEGERDPKALEHYRNMLTAARDSGVTPWICLHHFSLPRWFSDTGGFLVEANRDRYWNRHVDFVAEAFGDLAGGWKPINETNYYASIYAGAQMGAGNPSREDRGAVDEAIHLANAEAAVRLRQTGKPVCSIFGLSPAVALDDDPASAAFVDKFYASLWEPGLGLERDGVLRIRYRDPVERPDLRDAFDYIGFSYYSTLGARAGKPTIYPEDAPVSPLGYGIYADGVGIALDKLHADMPAKPLIVSEYGVGTDDDAQRADYIARGLQVAHEAITRGVNLAGFFSWTGVDNYEWTHGYDVKFGIIDADRNLKPSAQVFAAEALA